MKRLIQIILLSMFSMMNANANDGWFFLDLKERGSTTGELKEIIWGDFCYIKVISKDKKEHSFHCGQNFNDSDSSYNKKMVKVDWVKIKYSHPTLNPEPIFHKKAEKVTILK